MAKKALVADAVDHYSGSLGFAHYFFPKFRSRAFYLYAFLARHLDSEVLNLGAFAEGEMR
jgi:hypothetical protein